MKTAVNNYGPVVAGRSYKVISEGNRQITISVAGKPVCVFLWVFYDGKDY